ncbi:MAG: alanine racemase, partial [Chloroflexota bacterium]
MTDKPSVHDIETPSVLIDLDKVEANIRWMQDTCDTLGVRFRPHIKTHKSPAIAAMQMKAGAVGIACQKTTEAEVFVDAGFKDIQLPYNIVGASKTSRLAELAQEATITVTADSLTVIDGIAAAASAANVTIRVLIEIVGPSERTGAAPEDTLALAQRVLEHDSLDFRGVMIYPSTPESRPRLQAALDLLAANDIPVAEISGGGFGSLATADQLPELTELRIGTYVFCDWRSVVKGWATLDQCAMTVRATVVSANEPTRFILDSGSKALTADAQDGVHGYIVEYPDARLYKVNEEHGYVDVTACEAQPKVGDVVHVIPIHTCVVTNLNDQVYGVRGDELVEVFEVEARGLLWFLKA